jgi:hypothetical protein
MTYPLEAAGVGDYPVRVGSMLLTLVDPHRGFEKAYNRWYERDHYYAGCLVGPWLFAGSRWVAPRRLRDLRWPHEDQVARPWDAGCYVAIYWVEQGHHEEHFHVWARPQVRWLYGEGRGFAERRHIHTVLFDQIATTYRDADPVPIDLALDACYDGLVIAWMDARHGRSAADLQAELSGRLLPEALRGSKIESVSSWTPSAGENDPKDVPMDLGSAAGGPERTVQLFFVRGEITDALPRLRDYTAAVADADLADVRLVAPFLRTHVGTDRYVDELW